MGDSLRQRKTTETNGTHDSFNVLHALEELESRVHPDPDDAPDRPPIIDPQSPSSRDKLTLTWKEIPSWQQDNEFILTGYRR